MFKSLKKLLSKTTVLDDTWNRRMEGPVVKTEKPTRKSPAILFKQKPPPRSDLPAGGTPNNEEMREQIIATENAEQVHTNEGDEIRIIPAGSRIESSQTKRSFTEEGLCTQKVEFLAQTTEGKLIHPGELHGGGQCIVCLKFTDTLHYCNFCRQPICNIHAIPWQDVRLCPKHHKIALFQQDTWAEEEGK